MLKKLKLKFPLFDTLYAQPLLIFFPLLLALNAYPLYQILFFGEPPFYQNAFDEYSYLQYNFGQETIGIGRLLQAIPTFLHNLEISGGIQNLLFDLITPIIIFFSTSAIFKNKWLGILLTFGPFLVLSTNPITAQSFHYIISHETLIKYITAPEAWFLPFSRSPEPQLSLALLSFATYLSLRFKKPYLIFLILPFLYSFIIIPTLTALIIYFSCILIKKFFPKISNTTSFISSITVGFLSISTLLFLYFNFVASESFLVASTPTHLPLLPFTFLFTTIAFIIGKLLTQPQKLNFATKSLLVALPATQLIIVNTQLISGYISQPSNYEQNISVIIPILTLIIFLKHSQLSPKKIFLHISLPLLIITTYFLYGHFNIVFNSNHDHFLTWTKLKNQTDITEKLHNEPEKVLLEDLSLSSKISAFAYPKQASLPFDYRLTYFMYFKKENLQHYIDAKSYLSRSSITTETLQKTLETLDKAYQTLNMDFLLLHLNRKSDPFIPFNNLSNFTPIPNKEFYFYSSSS